MSLLNILNPLLETFVLLLVFVIPVVLILSQIVFMVFVSNFRCFCDFDIHEILRLL